ncbi:hypothetical protein [Lishizhenia sp.]|uniref:hypothetical protein n=1 Tax=Lishizhenia sp. TaxID=2497594 RepID=UPI00299CD8F3|nr:hypothetical protein [Lishizhenia sp.]MDX1444774.1 hypothetical protein [Lishizhenia sp.]
MRFFLFCSFSLCIFLSNAQQLKTNTFTIGINYNPIAFKGFSPYFTNMPEQMTGLYYQSIKALNTPVYSINYIRGITKKLGLNIGLNYSGLKHTELESSNRVATYIYHQYIESTRVKNDLVKLDFGIKRFKRKTGLGHYFLFNLSYNYIQSKIYRELLLTPSVSFNDYVKTYDPVSTHSQILGAEIGWGFIRAISDKLILDYGFKLNFEFFAFGGSQFQFEEGTYINEGILSTKSNLNKFNQDFLRYDILHFYLKLGLQKNNL